MESLSAEVHRILRLDAHDWPRILGVSRRDDASVRDSRYRKISALLHPDKRPKHPPEELARAGGDEACDRALERVQAAKSLAVRQQGQNQGHPQADVHMSTAPLSSATGVAGFGHDFSSSSSTPFRSSQAAAWTPRPSPPPPPPGPPPAKIFGVFHRYDHPTGAPPVGFTYLHCVDCTADEDVESDQELSGQQDRIGRLEATWLPWRLR